MALIGKRLRFAVAAIVAAAAGAYAAHSGVAASHGHAVVSIMGQASSVLFGIFGVWLGICYHDDIDTCLEGLRGEELRRRATEVKLVSERCRVLFTGLAVAASIFVFALVFAVVDAPLSRLTAGCLLARKILKALFFALVAIGVAAQIYSVLAPMAIMAEAMLKVDDAKRQADDLLNRLPPKEDSR